MENFAKWFYGGENWVVNDVVAGLLALALIATIILSFVVGHLRRKEDALRKEMDDNKAAMAELAHQKSDVDEKRLMMQNQYTSMSNSLKEAQDNARLNDQLAESYQKVFKEALIISEKAGDIAIDKSDILIALPIADVRAYGRSINADIRSDMAKEDMIKAIRTKENQRKSMDNARRKAYIGRATKAKESIESKSDSTAESQKETIAANEVKE